MDRWEEKEDRRFLRAGAIACAALNPHIDHKKTKALQPWDIFPHLPKPKPSRSDKLALVDSFFNVHNAKVHQLEARKKKRASA